MSDFKGVWIPAKVWECTELKLIEKHFLCQIKSLDNKKGCFASNSKFAKFFGISNPRCTQIIKSLEDKGFIKITLFREGLMIVKRVVNILNKGSKLFKDPIKEIKQPSKFIKEGVVNKLNYSNIKEFSNKLNNISESKYPYIANFQKIKSGELIRATQLDKNFDFSLFPFEWSENFKNEILKFWRYMESKKSDRWGVIGTISSQLSVIKSYLNDFSELEIIKAFNETVSKSNVSWNPSWTLKRAGVKSLKDSAPKKFTYPLPTFLDAEDRQSYFYLRYDSYKQHLDIQKVNTVYKQRALYDKDAEGLCFELELQIPKLTEIQVNYNRL